MPRSVSIHVRELDLSAPIQNPDLKFPGRTSLCAVQRTPGHGIGATAGGGPFSRTLDAVVTSFPRSEHRFRLALATQGVADAERQGASHNEAEM